MAFDQFFRPKDQATAEDRRFLRDDTPNSPFISDTEITICKAILGGLTNIAFVVQPYGAALAGVLTVTDGLLSLAYDSTNQTAEMARVLKESHLDEKVSGGMKGLKDFCEWLDTHQSSLRGLETKNKISRKDIVEDPDDSDNWLEQQIQAVLIAQTTPSGATLFTRMGLDIDKLEWDRPDIRVLCLAIDTYLFICYHMLVVVYARRARLALRAKDTSKWAQMQRDVYEQTQVYKRRLDQQIKWWTEKLGALKQWRIDQVTKVDLTNQTVPVVMDPGIGSPGTFWEWTDSYTQKTTMKMDFQLDELKRSRDDYLTDLGKHIDKALAGDWEIIKLWKPRLEETEKLLRPLKPAKAPAIQRWIAIPDINAALKEAVKVMYRYDLSSDRGATRSDKSEWTGELNLTEHDGKHPELLLVAENIPIELTITVYRRIAKKLEGPFDDETVADVTTTTGSDRLWSDRDTEPAGR